MGDIFKDWINGIVIFTFLTSVVMKLVPEEKGYGNYIKLYMGMVLIILI